MSSNREPNNSEHLLMRDVLVASAERMNRTRRHRRQLSAAGVSVVLVAGVVGAATATAISNGTQVAATPTMSATNERSTTPTPTPTHDSSDPAAWVVSGDGIGPLTLGMPLSDAVAMLPTQAHDFCSNAPGTVWVTDDVTLVGWDKSAPGGLDLVIWTGEGGPRTSQGTGVGSSESQVRAAYPHAVGLQRQGAPYLGGDSLFFDVTDGVVHQVVVTVEDGPPYELCG